MSDTRAPLNHRKLTEPDSSLFTNLAIAEAVW
jgi:hypothetical protein